MTVDAFVKESFKSWLEHLSKISDKVMDFQKKAEAEAAVHVLEFDEPGDLYEFLAEQATEGRQDDFSDAEAEGFDFEGTEKKLQHMACRTVFDGVYHLLFGTFVCQLSGEDDMYTALVDNLYGFNVSEEEDAAKYVQENLKSLKALEDGIDFASTMVMRLVLAEPDVVEGYVSEGGPFTGLSMAANDYLDDINWHPAGSLPQDVEAISNFKDKVMESLSDSQSLSDEVFDRVSASAEEIIRDDPREWSREFFGKAYPRFAISVDIIDYNGVCVSAVIPADPQKLESSWDDLVGQIRGKLNAEEKATMIDIAKSKRASVPRISKFVMAASMRRAAVLDELSLTLDAAKANISSAKAGYVNMPSLAFESFAGVHDGAGTNATRYNNFLLKKDYAGVILAMLRGVMKHSSITHKPGQYMSIRFQNRMSIHSGKMSARVVPQGQNINE